MFSYGTSHMAEQKQGNQLEPTSSSSVRIRNVAPRTCQKRWTIGWSGKRSSRISVLVPRQDDDDDWFYTIKPNQTKPNQIKLPIYLSIAVRSFVRSFWSLPGLIVKALDRVRIPLMPLPWLTGKYFWKRHEPPDSLCNRLDSILHVLLYGSLWHWISTVDIRGLYAIK